MLPGDISVRGNPLEQRKEGNEGLREYSSLNGATGLVGNTLVPTTPPPNDHKDITLYAGNREVIFIAGLGMVGIGEPSCAS